MLGQDAAGSQGKPSRAPVLAAVDQRVILEALQLVSTPWATAGLPLNFLNN